MSFNTATRRINWLVSGRYEGNPVLAKGVVYAINFSTESGAGLEARHESSGSLLWRWPLPRQGDGLSEQASALLVTDNLIFVSTDAHVYAVDLVTRRSVWSYWRGGSLALSANGVLYITTSHKVGAVNLK
jgi:outer membrane protein assembly factor BamB